MTFSPVLGRLGKWLRMSSSALINLKICTLLGQNMNVLFKTEQGLFSVQIRRFENAVLALTGALSG